MSDVISDLGGPRVSPLRWLREKSPASVYSAKQFMSKTKNNPDLVAGVAILLSLILMAIFAPRVAPRSPYEQDIVGRLAPPFWMKEGSADHILGTDGLGRDVFSRIIFGARISLIVAISAVALAGTIGLVVGLLTGYFGGWLDTLMMRWVDIQLSIPFVIFAIVFLVFFGSNLFNLIAALGLWGWMSYARLIRSTTMRIKEQLFIEAARAIGASTRRILFRHILPNVLGIFVVVAALQIGTMILVESFLSFIGLGVQPPTPSWGIMLYEGRPYLFQVPWLGIFPGVAIFITVLGVNLFGDGLKKQR